MELEVMRREVIKPTSSAPQDHLQLSLMDLYLPAKYVSTIFFYKVLPGESSEIISERLKSSLSKTLSRFYPLAGRIEGVSVSCNDQGAVFTKARTDLLLSDFLEHNLQSSCSLDEFFPQLAPEESAATWPLLRVQVTFFGSESGVAIAIAISHNICDQASALTFARGWAATTVEGDVVAPQFAGANIYPPPYSSSMKPASADSLFVPGGNCLNNRFLFKSSKISELKRKATTQSVHVPTRVEAIMSLLWRCARNASRASNSAAKKSTRMYLAMDLRLRIPSNVLSPFAVGNLLTSCSLEKDADREMEIGQIVVEIRKAKDGVNKTIKESLMQGYDTTTLGSNLLRAVGTLSAKSKSEEDLYAMTSWCRKPYYGVDFGWGTPVWVGTTSRAKLASMILIDSKNGEDVEAWVALPKEDMDVFIHDQDLLTFALLNPPVLI